MLIAYWIEGWIVFTGSSPKYSTRHGRTQTDGVPVHASRITHYALFLLPLLFLAVFYLYPLLGILRVSFFADGAWNFSGIGNTLRAPFFWRVLWFTTWQAAASTALTLLLGLPLAFIFARYRFPGQALLRALFTVPFVMPTVVVAVAFSALLGDSGLLNRWLQAAFSLDAPPLQIAQTVWIILLAHAFYNVSIVIRTVGGFWRTLGTGPADAARVLGAGPLRRLCEVTLPLLLPSIAAASLLVFLFCFTSFGVVLILGGLRFATLEVEIYRQARNLFNLPVAAFLALVQMALTFAAMALYTRIQARSSRALATQAEPPAPPQTRVTRLLIGLLLTLSLALLLSPLLTLAWRSFTWGGDGLGDFTLRYYAALAVNERQSAFFVAPLLAVRNSVLFAAATVVLSLVLGLPAAYLLARPRSWLTTLLDPIFLLPLGTSAVTLGFGYIVTMGPLRTSLWLVPVAHSLIAAPFVVRTFLPALRRLDPRLRETAALLGASPSRILREIDVPLLWGAALVGAVFAFTISLGEFGASLLITRPDFPTMPVVIYRALGQPGPLNYGQALAMSTILMVVSAGGLMMIERFRPSGASEF